MNSQRSWNWAGISLSGYGAHGTTPASVVEADGSGHQPVCRGGLAVASVPWLGRLAHLTPCSPGMRSRTASPARNRLTLTAERSTIRAMLPRLAPPRCSVIRTSGRSTNGLRLMTSSSMTSKPAPPRWPDVMACRSATSSTRPPRAVLIRTTPGHHRQLGSPIR